MILIPESQIEATAEQFNNSTENFETAIEALAQQQPHLLAYLLSEDVKMLTTQERDYLIYLAVVIWKAIHLHYPDLPTLSDEQIGTAEEANWAKITESKQRKFRDRLNVFFDNYPQEDLLAFVEDALIYDEEEDFITAEARIHLFIALKTIIDSFQQHV